MQFIPKPTTALAIVISAAAIGLASTASVTASSNEDDASTASILAAKISPAEALALAETESGGRVLELEFESEDGTAVYAIEIAMDDLSIRGLLVDASTGEVKVHDVEECEAEDDDDD